MRGASTPLLQGATKQPTSAPPYCALLLLMSALLITSSRSKAGPAYQETATFAYLFGADVPTDTQNTLGGQSDNSVTPFLPSIRSRTLMDCFVSPPSPTSDFSMRQPAALAFC